MQLNQVYKCLCDRQRLRILILLREGPLCVCHLMEILNADQVKISKQMRYLKEQGAVEGERRAQWMVYRLSDAVHPILIENLRLLDSSAEIAAAVEADAARRADILRRLEAQHIACKEAVLIEP